MDEQEQGGHAYEFIVSGEFLRGLALSVVVAVVIYLATAAAGFSVPEAWGPWLIGLGVGLVNVVGSAVLAAITHGGFRRG